ncbi:MAG: CPBP family intramembrane metalloprotease [Verrucomicrobia bacterium]|nr:CPBP family intramembrane metalloprotease [Verrucomicrobiota bacterium]
MGLTILAFLLLGLSFLSVWFRREPKVWGGLFGASLLAGLASEHVYWQGLMILAVWAPLWFLYAETKGRDAKIIFFSALVFLSFAFKLHLFPGFNPTKITPRFYLGYMAPIIGFFPLALLVPLASSKKDWKVVFTKGLGYSLAGIGIMAVLAIAAGSVSLQAKLPTYPGLRYLVNLVLVTIPEEAFYRGFIQRDLCSFLPNSKGGKAAALIITSLIFTMGHLYWSPTWAILGFVFLASLLYGWIYMATGKIESSILCHFLLNFIHMTFFTYHAM